MVYESEIRQSDWLLTRRRQLMFVAESADIPKQQQDLKKFKKKRKNQRKSIRKKKAIKMDKIQSIFTKFKSLTKMEVLRKSARSHGSCYVT